MGFFDQVFSRRPTIPLLRRAATAAVDAEGGGSSPPDHQAHFAESSVYFVWTQGTAKSINLGRAVEQLLTSEVATSAAWPSEIHVRLSPSIAKLDRDIAQLREMRDLTSALNGLRSIVLAALRHPRVATRVIGSVRESRRDAAGSGVTPPGHEPETPAEDHTTLEETLTELDHMLLESQKISMAERDLDASIFGGEAQDDDHYVRLVLRPTRHDININGAEHRVTLEPRLLLHRAGAIQLTIGVHLPMGLNTSELINGSHPSLDYITKSLIPEPYAGPRGRWDGGEWEPQTESGVRVRSLSHDGSASIYNYMGLVTGRVFELIKARPSGEWNCYPVVMAQAGSCCDDWAHSHKDDLLLVAARTPPKQASQFKYPLGPNFSVHSDQGFYLNPASALILYMRQWNSGIRDLNITLLIEHTMLVYTRLRRLERDVGEFRTNRKDVLRTYRSAMQLAQDCRGGNIRWVSGRSISKHLLAELGGADIQRSIDQGLSMLGERAAARTNERSARGSRRLSLVAVIIAAIAAIPGLPVIFDLINEQRLINPEVSAWTIIQTLVTSPILISILALCAVLLYLLFNAAVISARVVRYLFEKRKRGYASRLTGYRVTLRDTKGGDGQS